VLSATTQSATPRQPALAKNYVFDKKSGRCKRHPSVILARKSTFSKGWDILRDTCPLCQEENNKSLNALNGTSGEGEEEEFCEISKTKMNALLRGNSANHAASCSVLDAGHHPSPPGNGYPNASPLLRRQSASGEGNPNGNPSRNPNANPHLRRQSTPGVGGNAPPSSATRDSPAARVSRMPYTTPNGESGWYTGEINTATGQPHGRGRLRCKTGNQIDGEWCEGYSAEYLERRDRMRAGFGKNRAPWKTSVEPIKSESNRAKSPYARKDRAQSPYARADGAQSPYARMDRAQSPYARQGRAVSPYARGAVLAAAAACHPAPYGAAAYGGNYQPAVMMPAAPGMPPLAAPSPVPGHYPGGSPVPMEYGSTVVRHLPPPPQHPAYHGQYVSKHGF